MNEEVMKVITGSRVIVTCGTGGVGKTSCAAALGLMASREGRRAVVLTIDPAKRLADAIGLGDAVANEPVRVSCDATGELWVAMLDVQATFDSLVVSTSRNDEQAQRVLANPFYKGLSQSLSGTRDYMAAERLHSLADDPRFDVVIVDTPPTRSALDFLESPEKLARFLQHPIVKVLVAQGRGGLRIAGAAVQPVVRAIGKVIGNDALSGAIGFLQAFSGMESEFSQRALAVARLLRGDHTSFVVVASPSADAITEADWFVSELHRLSIDLRCVIENRVPPAFGGSVAGVFPGLIEESRAAESVLQGFRGRTETVFPVVARARATESAGDIHDMAGIAVLADQLSA
jgi:anion-transporting  ArsA/GET3 family ATPase